MAHFRLYRNSLGFEMSSTYYFGFRRRDSLSPTLPPSPKRRWRCHNGGSLGTTIGGILSGSSDSGIPKTTRTVCARRSHESRTGPAPRGKLANKNLIDQICSSSLSDGYLASPDHIEPYSVGHVADANAYRFAEVMVSSKGNFC